METKIYQMIARILKRKRPRKQRRIDLLKKDQLICFYFVESQL